MTYFISNLESKLNSMGLEFTQSIHGYHKGKPLNVNVLQFAYETIKFLQDSGANLNEFHVDMDKSGTTRVWVRDITDTLEFSFNELEIGKVGFKSHYGRRRDLTYSMVASLESFGIELTQKSKDTERNEYTKFYTLTGNKLQDNTVLLQMALTLQNLTSTVTV